MNDPEFSRRALLTGATALPYATLEGQSADRIVVHVADPAGPAPAGAPVETAIPFARGKLRWPGRYAVLSPRGTSVPAQMRPSSYWGDGSVRWLFVVFEPETGPGAYMLAEDAGRTSSDLVQEDDGFLQLDSGVARVRLRRDGWVEEISAPGPGGSALPIVRGAAACDLVITHRNGTVFRSSASAGRRLTIDERGPVRATVRMDGRCRSESGRDFFDYILRWTVYRGRPEVFVSVTWINTTPNVAEQVRDIRLLLPLEWQPERLVFGCERGVFDGPFVKGWPVWVLQEDENRYWAKIQNPDGRIQNLSSGGANGEQCPGWLYVTDSTRSLGVHVRDFREKYPSEIAVSDSLLSIGFWPARANAHLKSKTLLPSNPFGERPYAHTRYWPVMPHPYVAFVEPEEGCLDAPQGVAMSHEFVLSVGTGERAASGFEAKLRRGALQPVRGVIDPRRVASTAAAGLLAPRNTTRYPRIEQMFEENFGWFQRHTSVQKCYGKFDYGDVHYFTPGTDYLTTPGTKWGHMGEMAREGYWHNNERDPLRGLILYYLRTGSQEAWERCAIAARHALDVDIRHFPHWGMWTHGYGHCYLAEGRGGEPDHSWLLGLLHWAGISGDPVAGEWVMRCGERLAQLTFDFEQADARTVSVFLHMMCQFHLHTGRGKYVERARPAVAAFRKLQNANGSWPAYLGNLKQPRIEGFVEHVLVALADYYSIERDAEVRDMIDRALVHLFGEKGDGAVDPGESALALYALAVMADLTGERKYALTARQILEKLRESLNLSDDPRGRGDLWAEWGPNKTSAPGSEKRRPQLLGQTRPLSPSTLLAYGQPAMAALAKLSE